MLAFFLYKSPYQTSRHYGPFLCLHLLLIGTLYLHTFVLSMPYPQAIHIIMYCVLELGLAGVMGLQLCCMQKSAATDGVTDGKLEATAAERSDSTAAAAERSINSYVEDRTVPARSSALSATAIQKLIDEGLTTSTSSGATIGIRGPWTNIPVEPSIPFPYPSYPSAPPILLCVAIRYVLPVLYNQ